jgi:DNA-directed RNA polymerase subunit RPC12/RpoP
MGFSYPVPVCIDCGELIFDAKKHRLRCRSCYFKARNERQRVNAANYRARRKGARS